VGLASADCQLPIVNWPLVMEAIGNRKSTIGNHETHPLPRGGTDFTYKLHTYIHIESGNGK
jgi:hypothetical protein